MFNTPIMIRIALAAALIWLAASCTPKTNTSENGTSTSTDTIEISFDTNGDTVIVVKEFDLWVKTADEPFSTTWYQAQEQCEKNADGWRLPSKAELACLYKNREQIGGFKNDWYWSSERVGDWNVFVQSFSNGRQFGYSGSNSAQIRLVKNIQK
jgi:hypothetical protein